MVIKRKISQRMRYVKEPLAPKILCGHTAISDCGHNVRGHKDIGRNETAVIDFTAQVENAGGKLLSFFIIISFTVGIHKNSAIRDLTVHFSCHQKDSCRGIAFRVNGHASQKSSRAFSARAAKCSSMTRKLKRLS